MGAKPNQKLAKSEAINPPTTPIRPMSNRERHLAWYPLFRYMKPSSITIAPKTV